MFYKQSKCFKYNYIRYVLNILIGFEYDLGSMTLNCSLLAGCCACCAPLRDGMSRCSTRFPNQCCGAKCNVTPCAANLLRVAEQHSGLGACCATLCCWPRVDSDPFFVAHLCIHSCNTANIMYFSMVKND